MSCDWTDAPAQPDTGLAAEKAANFTVLIAIDASSQAESAFDWYMQHIHRTSNNLVICHSVDLSALTSEDDMSSLESTSTKRLWDKQRGRNKDLETKYRWKLNEHGIPGKIKTVSGKPGGVIIKAANEEKANLIVIGSRGLGRLKRTVSGSVSDYVLHNAKCPVIICRQPDSD